MSAATRKARAPDPGSLCRSWCERAQRGELPPLLLILPPASGEEETWFGERIAAAARQGARAAAGMELGDLDGAAPDFTPNRLDEFLGAPSLFAPTRALIFARAGKALKRWPRLAESLAKAAGAEGGPRWILVQAEGAGAAASAKALAARAAELGGETLRFRALYADPPPWRPDPDASEAAEFVRAEAAARGLKFDAGAAGLLVQIAGARPADLIQALGHFEMLGSTRVDEEAVHEVVAHSAEGNAFAFADAILLGDAGEVLRLLRRMDRQGLRTWDGRRLAPRDAFGLLVGAVARELTSTLKVRGALDAGAEPEAAVAAAGGGVTARKKLERRIGRCSRARLDGLQEALLLAERRVKREGWREPLHALEALALHAFQPAAAAGGAR